MTFWILAALLVLIALAFVLLPLRRNTPSGVDAQAETAAIYREKLADLNGDLAAGHLSPEQHALSLQELETRLVEDAEEAPAAAPTGNDKPALRRLSLALLVLAIPAITLGLYRYLGAPAILDAKPMEEARGKHDVDAMLGALEGKLAKQPEDAEGWYVLGRSYLAMQRIKDGEDALNKAVKLAPKEARYLAQYAEALAMANGGDLQGKARELVDQALEINPQEEKALELAGLSAYQRKEYAQAIHFWRRLLKRLAPDSEYHQDIKKAVDGAEAMAAKSSGLGDRAKLQPPPEKKNPH